MKPCLFRVPIEFEDRVGCEHPRVRHAGSVPISICESCILAKEPTFENLTRQLLVRKQATGEYKPTPKPCGGCQEAKHRSGRVQFVWPYWDSGAAGDELRWSIRSVEQFFQGDAHITLIGDRPAWWQGHVIPKRRVSARRPNRPFRDMLSKVWFMATHAEVDQKAVWMMDDIYYLRPFTIQDLEIPRAVRYSPGGKNSWQRRKANTMRVLTERGFPNHDYATHLPHVFEKQKLRDVFDSFDLHTNTLLWEVIYGNVYRGTPQDVRPFFRRITDQLPEDRWRHETRHATVLNHTSGAWCPGVRAFLQAMLPEQSPGEIGPAVSPAFIRKPKQQRTVKRRPPKKAIVIQTGEQT
jgi:hypothetical protein